MKKLFLVLAMVLFVFGIARAELSVGDIIKAIPSTNQGVFYNINDNEFEYTSTLKVLSYKGFNLNAGFATEQTGVISLAYDIINLEKLGVDIPILKQIVIDAGWTVGLKRIGVTHAQNEFVNGPSVTLKVKF